jgi:hypothetical protein
MRVALGLKARTGRAALVAVAGDVHEPQLVETLADPAPSQPGRHGAKTRRKQQPLLSSRSSTPSAAA